MLKIGDKAPNFSLLNQDDVEISLNSFSGKWVVLYFYPKDNTKGCTTEACDFTNDMPQFEELDAVIIGISPDSTKKHRNFIEKRAIGFTLLSDESKDVIKLYDAWGVKKMCGREYEGVIRSTYLIAPDGKIAQIWKNVRVKNHTTKVKEELQKLQQNDNNK
jgi:peroxiredoxin Q/BCP